MTGRRVYRVEIVAGVPAICYGSAQAFTTVTGMIERIDYDPAAPDCAEIAFLSDLLKAASAAAAPSFRALHGRAFGHARSKRRREYCEHLARIANRAHDFMLAKTALESS